MSNSFGEVSWLDNSGANKGDGGGKDLFLHLDDGENEMRVVTPAFQYLSHKLKKDPNDKKDYGRKIMCSKVHGTCPFCDLLGDKPKARWFIGVISRKTGKYQILDMTYGAFGGIKKLAQNTKSWGDPTKYDICIIFNKKARVPADFYNVQPLGKTPLSAEDQVLKDSADLKHLERLVTPPSAEKVVEQIEKFMGGPLDLAAHYGVKSAEKSNGQVASEEGDEEFPAFNAT